MDVRIPHPKRNEITTRFANVIGQLRRAGAFGRAVRSLRRGRVDADCGDIRETTSLCQ